MSNVIARAEHEVFLATNFWMYSEPTRLITNVRYSSMRQEQTCEQTRRCLDAPVLLPGDSQRSKSDTDTLAGIARTIEEGRPEQPSSGRQDNL
jgi:hypothetical protein